MHSDSDGDTALHHAASGGYAGVVRALIETGADVEAFGWNGKTPLMCAAKVSMKTSKKTQLYCHFDKSKLLYRPVSIVMNR